MNQDTLVQLQIAKNDVDSATFDDNTVIFAFRLYEGSQFVASHNHITPILPEPSDDKTLATGPRIPYARWQMTGGQTIFNRVARDLGITSATFRNNEAPTFKDFSASTNRMTAAPGIYQIITTFVDIDTPTHQGAIRNNPKVVVSHALTNATLAESGAGYLRSQQGQVTGGSDSTAITLVVLTAETPIKIRTIASETAVDSDLFSVSASGAQNRVEFLKISDV